MCPTQTKRSPKQRNGAVFRDLRITPRQRPYRHNTPFSNSGKLRSAPVCTNSMSVWNQKSHQPFKYNRGVRHCTNHHPALDRPHLQQWSPLHRRHRRHVPARDNGTTAATRTTSLTATTGCFHPVPSDSRGTIAGNRRYAIGTTEGPMPHQPQLLCYNPTQKAPDSNPHQPHERVKTLYRLIFFSHRLSKKALASFPFCAWPRPAYAVS